MTEKGPLLTHDAISDAMLETKGFFPGLLSVRLLPCKLRLKPKYGEKRFRAKIDLGYIKGKLQNDTLKGYKFSFFSLLPQHDNFLSLFQFVSGCRSEREVCSINGTGSLAYSRSGSKYYYI